MNTVLTYRGSWQVKFVNGCEHVEILLWKAQQECEVLSEVKSEGYSLS